MANEGVDSKEEQIQFDARISPPPKLLTRCLDLARREYPPRMGWHVAQGRPRRSHADLAINMVGCHLKAHSWMEQGRKRSQSEGRQLPYVGLMVLSLIRRMTIGTVGGCVVL